MDNREAPQSLYPYDGVVLWVSGELDLLTAPILRRRLHQAAAGGTGEAGAGEGGAGELVVDLSAVTFMDCAGLEPLLEARAYLGGRLCLRGVPWAVVHMLRVTGLLTTFTILDPIEAGTGDEQARRHDEAFAQRLALGPGLRAAPGAAAHQDRPADRSAGEPEGQRARVLDLPEARHHTPTIEQAKGLLMGTHGCGAGLAWQLLLDTSRRYRVPVRALAVALTDDAAGDVTGFATPRLRGAVRAVMTPASDARAGADGLQDQGQRPDPTGSVDIHDVRSHRARSASR